MGLILDTDVLIRGEKQAIEVDFTRWAQYGEAYISAITCSELLVGVHRANTGHSRSDRAMPQIVHGFPPKQRCF